MSAGFPRIPHLVPPHDARDDVVLSVAARAAFFATPVIVEEKVDGANVSIELDEARAPRISGRSGRTTMDRAGQFGRLRAWAAERWPALDALLGAGEVIYGEWMYLTHGVFYDALPDLLIVLDLWSPARGFIPVAERDARCAQVELSTVPVRFRGVLGGLDALSKLHGPSAFSSELAEGLVLRREEDGRLVERAKWIAPGFEQVSDAAWGDSRRYNVVASAR